MSSWQVRIRQVQTPMSSDGAHDDTVQFCLQPSCIPSWAIGTCRDMQAALVERVRHAVTLPVRIRLRNQSSAAQNEAECSSHDHPSRRSAASSTGASPSPRDDVVQRDDTTQLLVTAPVDSGGRGRPRVTYDVTAALNSLSAWPCRLSRLGGCRKYCSCAQVSHANTAAAFVP